MKELTYNERHALAEAELARPTQDPQYLVDLVARLKDIVEKLTNEKAA